MRKIDIFAHVLPQAYLDKMLSIDSMIAQKYAFTNIPSLKDQA